MSQKYKKKRLVLSPHEELLSSDCALLLAGKWCQTPELNKKLGSYCSVDIVGYPWDDRDTYRNDFYLIIDLYEFYLVELSRELSRIHGNSWSVKEWRVLIGPALYTVISHSVEKWRLAEAIQKCELTEDWVAFGFEDYFFTKSYTRDIVPDAHEYNHFILQRALYSLGVIPRDIIPYVGFACNPEAGKHTRSRSGLKRRLTSLAVRIFGPAALRIASLFKAKVVVCETYLPKWVEVFLALAVRGVPLLRAPRTNIEWIPDRLIRNRLNLSNTISGQNPTFTFYLSQLIRELLPTFALEGFSDLTESVKKSNLPIAPSVIYTANAFQFNELFQYYIADRIHNNTKLIIGQHGGVTGILQWSFGEMHQKLICDRFLSWGQQSADRKTKRAFVFQNFGKRISPKNDGGLLLTTVPMRVYHHKGGSWPVGPNQSHDFLQDQLALYRSLSGRIKGKTTLRIFSQMDRIFHSHYVNSWLKEFPNVMIDHSTRRIDKALSESRIHIYTYNSTGYLECLSLDYPTLLFWNEKLFESTPEFSELMVKLEEVGLYHRTAESCAKFVSEIWDDIPGWWESEAVVIVKKMFSDRFCLAPRFNSLITLRDYIKNWG